MYFDSIDHLSNVILKFLYCPRRQDSSIGFGAPVRANMRRGGLTNAAIASSLLESVSAGQIRL